MQFIEEIKEAEQKKSEIKDNDSDIMSDKYADSEGSDEDMSVRQQKILIIKKIIISYCF